MRRVALALAIGGCLALLLACSMRLAGVWTSQVDDLVLPGVADVQIGQHSLGRLQLSYRFLPGQTRQQLRLHMLRQGWRQVKTQNIERLDWTFTRVMWSGLAREVAIVKISEENQRVVTILVGRCFKISSWAGCL
jgi:hypothetical protein